MKSKILGLLAAGLLAGPIAANAIVVTYDFSTSGPYSGQFSYEDTNSTAAPAVADYNEDTTWYSAISFVVNGIGVGAASIGILDLAPSFVAIFIASSNGLVRMNFFDDSATLFSGEMISNANGRTLTDFDVNIFVPSYSGPPYDFYTVTSLIQRIAEVPEPGTLALLGLGLLGLGISRRKA